MGAKANGHGPVQFHSLANGHGPAQFHGLALPDTEPPTPWDNDDLSPQHLGSHAPTVLTPPVAFGSPASSPGATPAPKAISAAPVASPCNSALPPKQMLHSAAPVHGSQGSHEQDGNEGGVQKRLADGVDLVTKKNLTTYEFEYSIINRKLAGLDFTAELSAQSENMKWNSGRSSGKKCKVNLKPKEQKVLGTLNRQNPQQGARFGLKFSLTPKPLSREEVLSDEAPKIEERKSLAERLRRRGILASKMNNDAGAVKQACQQAGIQRFLDVEFMPDDKSLFAKPEDPKNPPVIWRRPSEFMHGEIKLFSGSIAPSDIKQGALGDCWFLAALASLAEFPKLVQNIFAKTSYNETGVYEICCYKNGFPMKVVVDDLFPCDPSSGTPCYSHAEGNELWVLLLEKAWAKIHGTYERIEGGLPYRALMDLTGDTGESYDVTTIKPSLWERLSEFDRLGYLMCASTPGHDELTKSNHRPSAGIVPGHAYTLKGVKEYKGIRLVNLRNPWGQFEWDGDWSDKSPLWTQEMKRAIKPTLNGNDGSFWMDEADFVKNYNFVNVCFMCGGDGRAWKTSRTPLTLSGESDICDEYIVFDIAEEGTGFITLEQVDDRILGTPEYTELCFAVYGPFQKSGVAKETLRSDFMADRELVVEVHNSSPLPAGKYAIAIFNPKKASDVPLAVVLHVDAEDEGRGQMVLPVQVHHMRPTVRQRMALATAVSSADAQVSPLGPMETSGNWTPGGGYALAARSKVSDRLSVSWDFSKSRGLELIGGSGMKVTTTMEPNGQWQLIGELVPIGDRPNFSFGIRYHKLGDY